ncbi:ORF6C domain-containing protein [Weissella paramesenteroides]|uniref:ORF6C domain-containing protein n=1 Tax=Weissella paramesenteroides TaxID=1249 RepID=UPI003D3644C2
MANEVQVFNFEQMNVRTVEIDDEVWFVAVDVAKALEIKNVSDALKRLDDDERGRFNLGRQGETNVISEAGLYRFIGGSRKKEAKQFMRWVNHEVLPSIRKTGGYQAQPALRLPKNNAEMLQVVQNVNEETNKRIDQVETTVDELKDRFGLPASQAKSLEQARKRHIVTLLGGFESNAYQHLSGKTFRQIGGDFKDYFEVPRYDALPLSKFDEGMSYIKAWQLPTNLALQVRNLNLQTELEV